MAKLQVKNKNRLSCAVLLGFISIIIGCAIKEPKTISEYQNKVGSPIKATVQGSYKDLDCWTSSEWSGFYCDADSEGKMFLDLNKCERIQGKDICPFKPAVMDQVKFSMDLKSRRRLDLLGCCHGIIDSSECKRLAEDNDFEKQLESCSELHKP